MIKQLLKNTQNIWLIPFVIMGFLVLGDMIFHRYLNILIKKLYFLPNLIFIEQFFYLICIGACAYWLMFRGMNALVNRLERAHFYQRSLTFVIVFPFFVSLLKIMIFLILFNVITQKLTLPSNLSYFFNKTSSILIICSMSAILFKLITIAEQLLLKHYNAELRGIMVERKIYTQTLILKRAAYSIVAVLTIGAILMLFDNVRALGASVMTTAGIIGLVLTFTAQRSLSSIFSGLEIALTQSIKIGDKVKIENKEGVIQEINFRNVVLRLGDWSHYIVPTSSFLEKPFQNWNRIADTNLLGATYLYVDFTIPIPKIRARLNFILKQTPFWDKNIGRLLVSELQEKVMQLKIIVSAHDPDSLADLLAHIREELIDYIVNNFPECLPRTRSFALKEKSKENSFIEMD